MTAIYQNSKSIGIHSKNFQTEKLYSQFNTKNQETGATNPELVNWYEEATAYYNAVISGAEAQPDPTAWQGFLDQMEWAAGQLGFNAPQAWDPMAQGQGGLPSQQDSGDPFGGQPGAMDNLVYTEETTKIGFTGEERTMDIWSSDITLDVAATSVDVVVEETQDTRFQPPETVLRVVMTDKATGKESVYILHDPEEIESLKLNTPGAKHVTDNSGRAEIGEFLEGANGAGLPPGADIDGDTAVYSDTVAGETLDFGPDFAGIGNFEVYANANITVKNGDEVLVERLGDDGYRVTITNLEGENTVFTVPEGFYLNINAHEPNVTFKNAPGKSSGDLGSLAVEKGPQRTPVTTDGTDGVPAEWENFSLNRKGPGEDENGELPEMHERMVDFLGAFTDPQLELDDIPAGLRNEIKYGTPPPSQELLQFIAQNDNTLRHRIQNEDWKGVRNRLVEMLKNALDMEVTKPKEADIEADKYAHPDSTFIIDGVAYEFDSEMKLTKIEESEDAAGTDGTDETDPLHDDMYAQSKVEEFKPFLESMSDVLGISFEEMIQKIAEMSTQEKGNLWHIMDYTTERGFMPWDLDRLMPVLVSLDPTLEQALNAFAGSGTAHGSYTFIRDRVVSMLQVLYPNAGISAGSHIDSVTFFGEDYDIIDEDGDHSSDPMGWLSWTE